MSTPCVVYDFRANQNLYEREVLIHFLKKNCKKWTFQLEQGDTGYVHYQGRFSLIKKRRKNELMKLMKDQEFEVPNYLEPSITEYRNENFYVLKVDTRIEGPFSDEIEKLHETKYIPRQYRDIKLYSWQQKIYDSCSEFEPRKINLIYDPEGNKGKTTVAALCEIIQDAIDLPPLNDYKEIIQLVCNICMDKKIRKLSGVFIDLPRSMDKTRLYGIYSAIEQIKKGKLYDIRYHYKAWWIDSPQIWVFTNKMPDLDYLSKDRWNIYIIDNNELIKKEIKNEEFIENPLDGF